MFRSTGCSTAFFLLAGSIDGSHMRIKPHAANKDGYLNNYLHTKCYFTWNHSWIWIKLSFSFVFMIQVKLYLIWHFCKIWTYILIVIVFLELFLNHELLSNKLSQKLFFFTIVNYSEKYTVHHTFSQILCVLPPMPGSRGGACCVSRPFTPSKLVNH